jgi:phosphatidylglycerophosphatase A
MTTIKIEGGDDTVLVPTFRFLFSHPAHFIALGFGGGMLAIMPGTMGTLIAWGMHYFLLTLWPEIFTPLVWHIIIGAGFLIGVWACERTGRDMGKPDHGSMVWDEMVAFWLVLLFVTPAGAIEQFVAFILFRFFDMVKPPPIRYFDQQLKGGFGVMWDDILAAFYTLLIMAFWRTLAN